MADSAKRKNPPDGGPQGSHPKKSKGGNANKWKTPHHKAKLEALRAKGRTLEPGYAGFWVTCQRNQEARALEELISICDEYGEKVYGIKAQNSDGDVDEDGGDIESSIQKEIESMKSSNKGRKSDSPFAPMRFNLDCLLFMRTKPPVEPRQLVRRICEDAKSVADHTRRKSRFINRFTPITLMGKATEHGVEEVAKTVLAEHFQLAGEEDLPQEDKKSEYSYAIRISIRAHNSLKRDDVIKQVAALIGPRHKVNLSDPDKVILIEIFQTFYGMSVVDGDWGALKKYNLRELYEAASKTSDESAKQSDKTAK